MGSQVSAWRRAPRAVGVSGLALALAGGALIGTLSPSASADPHVQGKNLTCAKLGYAPPPPAEGWDDTGKVDPPVSIDNEYITTAVYDVEAGEPYKLDVTAKEGFLVLVVIVKGSDDDAIYFEDFTALEAPINNGGQRSAISNYTICGKEKPPSTTPPSTTPPSTTPPSTTPPSTTPPSTTPPSTTPPSTTPPGTPPTEDLAIDVLTPICDGDVPYLVYEVRPVGFEATDLRMIWDNPSGDDFVYEDLALSGRVLWPGAEVDDEGNPLDWPGWTLLDDGTWVEGDEWDWVRPSVEMTLEVNPAQTVAVDYPPSSPQCMTNPPSSELPQTGLGQSWPALAGAAMVAAGLAVMFGRRFARR